MPTFALTDTRLPVSSSAGAKDVGVEFFLADKELFYGRMESGILLREQRNGRRAHKIKSYLDYGISSQYRSTALLALRGPQDCVGEIKRNVRIRGMRSSQASIRQAGI